MGSLKNALGLFAVTFAQVTFIQCAGASDVPDGRPSDAGMWHQPPNTEIMEKIAWFDTYTFLFITPITLFVTALLVWVVLKYNAKTNPKASNVSHNTTVEVVWTVVPIIILIAIALPSFQLLEDQFNPGEEPALTVKAIGQTWYWDYEYQIEDEISFTSSMLLEEDRLETGKTDREAYPRLLAVDNEMVVPVGKTVRVLVTADAEGVIHGFAVPAFGLKMDAIPGRINETWFKARRTGLYYGQCSELCGKDHAFMPIAIRVVSQDQYNDWASVASEDLEQANTNLIAALEAEKSVRVAIGNQ